MNLLYSNVIGANYVKEKFVCQHLDLNKTDRGHFQCFIDVKDERQTLKRQSKPPHAIK